MVNKLMADHSPIFEECPRCGVAGLERLATHSYCIECNYSRVYSQEVRWIIPKWVLAAIS